MPKKTKIKTVPQNDVTAPASFKKPAQSTTGHHSRKRWLIFGVSMGVVLLVSSIGAGAVAYYSNRALPNVTLAGVPVGNKTKDEIMAIAAKQAAAIQVTFKNGETSTATLKDLGVTVDIGKSVQSVLADRRDILYNLDFWNTRRLPLTYTADVGIFKAYIKQHFPSLVVDAKDAQLVYNDTTQQFDVQPGEAGKGVDLVTFTSALDKLASQPRSLELPVTTATVQPIIKPAALSPLQTYMNDRQHVKLRFTYQGREIYVIDPPDIANWANFTPNPLKGTVNVTYDSAKIKQFLNQKIGPVIAAPPVDRKVIHDDSTGQDVVIQAGQIGRQLDDTDGLANKIIEALNKNQPLDTEVAITTAPFKTVNLAGSGRWVEVDLSEQRTILWLGSTKVASFLISSGVSWAPTVTGEFSIRYKTPIQVMTGGNRASGDYYYLPNVTWDSYFYQDYAFHTAYWHNNFGHPMSHGCINMREADAHELYDFAPIGTKVIVHA